MKNFDVLWGMGVRRIIDACSSSDGTENSKDDGGSAADNNNDPPQFSKSTFSIDSATCSKSNCRTIEMLTLNVTDEAKSDIVSCFPAAFDFINFCQANKTSCLVHCHSGMSRSCTIAIGFVMKYGGGG